MRRPDHRAVLDRSGAAVRVHELQGDLFFAAMERIAKRVASDAGGAEFLVLDGRRVGRVDPSARTLLADLRDGLASRGVRVLLAGFPPAPRDALTEGDAPAWRAEDLFASADEALEWCEDRLIARARAAAGDDPSGVVPLGGMDVAAGLDEAELAVLGGLVSRAEYAPGEPIVREGDAAGELLMLAAGTATVSVRLGDDGRRKRLGSIGAGVTFGELALFEGGPRTADVTADGAAVCYVLPVARLRELSTAHPTLEARLLRSVGRVLAQRLRQANEEIRALEG
jgi:glutaminase